jgi:hypothetical protein
MRHSARGVGADIVIRPRTALFFLSASLPGYCVLSKAATRSKRAGILVQPLNGFGNSVNGLDLTSFNRLSGGFLWSTEDCFSATTK